MLRGVMPSDIGDAWNFFCSAAAVVLQAEEISEHRLVRLPAALKLLRKPIRRRVAAAHRSGTLRYLENGRPVPGIGRPGTAR